MAGEPHRPLQPSCNLTGTPQPAQAQLYSKHCAPTWQSSIAQGYAAHRRSCEALQMQQCKAQVISTLSCHAVPLGMKPVLPSAGVLGFYKGMRAKIVQSILAAALLMAIKEQLTIATAAVLDPKVSFHASLIRHID